MSEVQEQPAPAASGARRQERLELVATVVLALATVLTAWSAFESTKWSGTQSVHFARAGADRTESAKAESRANSQTIVDVDTFVSWLGAISDERAANPDVIAGDGTYQPDPQALSGFLYLRFRDEFKPAFDAWVAQRPLSNPDAPPTPFAVPEYDLAERRRSDQLDARADRQSALARRDNQRGDNYVLTAVLFASVLFFAGISTKLSSSRSRLFMVSLAIVVLFAGLAILATFPRQV